MNRKPKRRVGCVTTTFIRSVSALVTLVAVSPAAFADDDPAMNEVYFKKAPRYIGTGCLKGTATTRLSADKKAFNIVFDNYVAEINPGEPFQRKFCLLEISLHVPKGWTYAIKGVTYRGALQLDQGTSARENSVYFFKGRLGAAQTSSTWVGPIDDQGLPVSYEFTDELPEEAWVWQRCGKDTPLKIKSDYIVRNNQYNSGHAFASADTIDGQVSTHYHFAFKRCKPVIEEHLEDVIGGDSM